MTNFALKSYLPFGVAGANSGPSLTLLDCLLRFWK